MALYRVTKMVPVDIVVNAQTPTLAKMYACHNDANLHPSIMVEGKDGDQHLMQPRVVACERIEDSNEQPSGGPDGGKAA